LQAAKAKYWQGYSDPLSTAYTAMQKFYREYRRDALVRGCINTLAFWATKEGFEVIIESPVPLDSPEAEDAFAKSHDDLKAYIDKINTQVNADKAWRTAIIGAKIWGTFPFEIERNSAGSEPKRLIPLDPENVKPLIDEKTWEILGFDYSGMLNPGEARVYQPEQLLYFINNPIFADYEGLSDIEPILDDLETRAKIRQEDLKEAATTLWAGIGVASLDVDRLPAGTTQTQVQTAIDDFIENAKPGKWIAIDNRWDIETHDIKPDLDKLLNVKKEIDLDILGNFQVPKFLVNREQDVNRATSYSQMESFVDGPITDIQRWLKREIEKQWYEPLARAFLKLGDKEELPVKVTHRWRQIRTADFFNLLDAATKGYAQGMGMLDKKKSYELMRDGQATEFDPDELEKAFIPPPVKPQAPPWEETTPPTLDQQPPVEKTPQMKGRKK
jgi:hypothetical protein